MIPVLRVNNLNVKYYTDLGEAPVLRNINIEIKAGEKFGIAGESGSGKSTLAAAILGMIKPPGKITGGEIFFEEQNLSKLSAEKIRQVRGEKISLIPQGALNSLNPVLTIKAHLMDTLRDHGSKLSKAETNQRIETLLGSVGLEKSVAKAYSHQLSGGMKQRVCIALSLILQPKLIIADEPTSALDVVTQRQVIETLGKLQRENNTSFVLIGHDLGLMAQFVDKIAILYGGKIVEVSEISSLLENPKHVYTKALINSIPSLDKHELGGIPGVAPSLYDLPSGCVFAPRCSKVMEVCRQKEPLLQTVSNNQKVACHLYS